MIVIEITAVEKVGPSQMRFARIRTQANDSLERGIRQSKTARRVVEPKKIEIVVRRR